MLYSVDRLEGCVAVLVADDTGAQLDIPQAALPAGTKAGHMLRKTTTGWRRDTAAEQARRQDIGALLGKLNKKPKE